MYSRNINHQSMLYVLCVYYVLLGETFLNFCLKFSLLADQTAFHLMQFDMLISNIVSFSEI